jgi:TPR repeat protein
LWFIERFDYRLDYKAVEYYSLAANKGSVEAQYELGWMYSHPRHAYLCLGTFALQESERNYSYLDALFGGVVEKKGFSLRFDHFINQHKDKKGVDFLRAAASFVNDQRHY